MGRIYWLASYPKSGNTWTRLVLANYRGNQETPIEINRLGGVIASSRQLFDNFAGIDVSELTPDEIERYRPQLYRSLAVYQSHDIFVKIHDAFTRNSDGMGLVPVDATKGVIYLLRNPLDVAVSFAHHRSRPIQGTVDLLCRPEAKIGKTRNQVAQQLFSWSRHVTSWVDDSDLPVHVSRYEDMVNVPEATFGAMLGFAGFHVDTVRLGKAIDAASFDRLKAQEENAGFREKPQKASAFFRKGRIGSWGEELTARQVRQLIEAHGPVMRRFGYLTEDGAPVY